MPRLIIPLFLVLSTPALADPCTRLREAITRFDVGATIADDDVRLWNSIIRSAARVCPQRRRK